jgi:multidrug transporter EmrE-like cation transporter
VELPVGYIYILLTVIFTVIGQIMLKWRMDKLGALPSELFNKILFLAKAFMDPFIIISLGSAFIASVFWMAAMTKFDISYAYPFMSLSYVIVLVASFVLFKEPITMYKIAGLLCIAVGIVLTSKSI